MPSVYFDEREMRFCVTENATQADLRRLAELIGMNERLDAERSHPELRGDLAGFTQECRLLKPNEKNAWPVDWKEIDGEIHYRMSPVMAQWWKEA